MKNKREACVQPLKNFPSCLICFPQISQLGPALSWTTSQFHPVSQLGRFQTLAGGAQSCLSSSWGPHCQVARPQHLHQRNLEQATRKLHPLCLPLHHSSEHALRGAAPLRCVPGLSTAGRISSFFRTWEQHTAGWGSPFLFRNFFPLHSKIKDH